MGTKTVHEEGRLSIMASYGVGKFLAEFLTGAFAALVFKFYETEIGLSAAYCALGLVLYSVWNAVNDPIIGFFTAKPTPLAHRLGRRFPWILFGSFSCVLCFVLIFAVPEALDPVKNSFLIFLWLTLSICLYDALYSTWELNYQSIFPDKFRDPLIRSRAAGIATLVGVFGIAGGAVLPTFIIRYGEPLTYLANAWVFLAVGVAAVLCLLPGARESRPMIERYLAENAKGGRKELSFFRELGKAFKEKNFLAFILLYFFYQSGTICMTGSIHYVGDYILGGRSTTLIFAGMLGGALVSIPLWLLVGKKILNNQSMLVICALCLAAFSLPMTFVSSYSGYLVCMTLWGTAFGGFWLFMTPAMADVIDEIVVKNGFRNDGIYLGFRAFFGRLSYAVQALTFWAVHSLTGFASDPRSARALFGIHIHMALVPTILILIGVVVFWRLNDLDRGKNAEIKERLISLGL